jgi:hypothetical protein
MVDRDEIQKTFDTYFTATEPITIDDKGLVSCWGNVYLHTHKRQETLPVAFEAVYGDFDCSNNSLKTLQGAPIVVGSFNCRSNHLITLMGAPKSVAGSFSCSNNRLLSLEGAPVKVGGHFNCYDNPDLQSLKGISQELGKTFRVTWLPELPLLGALVAKDGVGFYHQERLQTGSAKKVEAIINRYKGQGRRGAFACKKALIEAGFEGNARW